MHTGGGLCWGVSHATKEKQISTSKNSKANKCIPNATHAASPMQSANRHNRPLRPRLLNRRPSARNPPVNPPLLNKRIAPLPSTSHNRRLRRHLPPMIARRPRLDIHHFALPLAHVPDPLRLPQRPRPVGSGRLFRDRVGYGFVLDDVFGARPALARDERRGEEVCVGDVRERRVLFFFFFFFRFFVFCGGRRGVFPARCLGRSGGDGAGELLSLRLRAGWRGPFEGRFEWAGRREGLFLLLRGCFARS